VCYSLWYLLIKYIKSFLWRVAKCLSYIEEARCLKVKQEREYHLTDAVFRYLVQCIWRELLFPLHAHRQYGNLYNAHNIGHPKSDSLYLVPFGHT